MWKRISCDAEGGCSIGLRVPACRGATLTIGNRRVHRMELCKSANLKNAIRVRQSVRTGHFREPGNKNDAPAEKPWTWRRVSFSSKQGTRPRSTSPTEAWVMPAPSSKESEEREFVVASGASMPMLSEKVSSSAELETLQRCRNPTTVITANGEVQTSEEAQVCVHDLELFVTVEILEDACRLVIRQAL